MSYKRYRNWNDGRRHAPNRFLNRSDGRSMVHYELYQALGLNPNRHLPDEGVDPQEIGLDKVLVWVDRKIPGMNQDAKRTWAECPACACKFTAGKLWMHLLGCKQLDNYS